MSTAPKDSKASKTSKAHGDIASGVDFFKAKNYDGEPTHYAEKDAVIDVPIEDNDKYLSADIGTNSKLYAWQHYDHSGNHREWQTDQPDLTVMGGISQFMVAPNDTNGIWVKLTNNTSEEGIFTMFINVSEDIGERTVASNVEDYSLVGVIPDNGQDHIAQIAVREPNDDYGANGSCFFKSINGDIILTEGPNFPPNMSVTEDDDRFNFSLDVLLPDGG